MTIEKLLGEIRGLAARLGRPARLMEVCGTHTMAAFRSGLRSLLPKDVQLLSGPGCPVCVTPDDYIDEAVALARDQGVLVATFGDMLRVPGTELSLEEARAHGAQVRVVYSPLDALQEAERRPDRRVVFLGVGFETTAPAVAWTIRAAAERGVKNYAVLCAHRTIPRAMAALLEGGEARVDGFMCPGHVSAIIGAKAYDFICRDHHVPCVVAGFEAQDMAAAIAMLLRQRVENRAEVEIQYTRCVAREGNARALAVLAEVLDPCDAEWRGLGTIAGSGLRIRDTFSPFDAARRFAHRPVARPRRVTGCLCGDVLRGARTPPECPLFQKRCTPATPVGPCMVSGEGTCAAYYRYAIPSCARPGARPRVAGLEEPPRAANGAAALQPPPDGLGMKASRHGG